MQPGCRQKLARGGLGAVLGAVLGVIAGGLAGILLSLLIAAGLFLYNLAEGTLAGPMGGEVIFGLSMTVILPEPSTSMKIKPSIISALMRSAVN